MEAKRLNVESRQGGGKSVAGRLRDTGKIPAVIYGHTVPTSITVDAREFRNAFKRITENAIVELHLGTAVHEVLVKDYQKDNLTGQILHVDFYEFEKGKALRTRVPIRLTGNPIGVKEGGILEEFDKGAGELHISGQDDDESTQEADPGEGDSFDGEGGRGP